MELLKRKNQRNRKYSFIIIMGIFIMLLGISAIIYHHYNNKKQDLIDNQLIEEFFEIEDIEDDSTNEIVEEEQTSTQEVVNYIAILEIPKINLKRGLVDKNSSSNNVNRNIYTLKQTTLPDEKVNSHIILAAHSGNSYVSFFKNLKKLDMNDIINFYYKGIKYVYKVSNKYEIEKTGTAELMQSNKSDITLITCISGTKKQIVYVANLIDAQNY